MNALFWTCEKGNEGKNMWDNNKMTIPELARKTGKSVSKINREIRILRDDFHVMKRVRGLKDGYWVIILLIIRYSIEMS